MGDVDPNLALFANWVREEEKRERDARRSAKAVKDEERKAQDLARAKDEAAAQLKRVRQSPSAGAEEKAAAEAGYRQALAAVVAAETGSAPDWAPPPDQAPDDPPADELVEPQAEPSDDEVPTEG